jgi:hypothetical protein
MLSRGEKMKRVVLITAALIAYGTAEQARASGYTAIDFTPTGLYFESHAVSGGQQVGYGYGCVG